jgi:hypothetical protein
MRWFHRERKPDVWETAGVEPAGDIEAAQKIREICAAAETIAGQMADDGGPKVEKDKASDAERYQAAIKSALEMAQKISDAAMRDVSVSQIIRLCVKVNHLKTAKVLLRAIHADATRAELIAESPALGGQDAAS